MCVFAAREPDPSDVPAEERRRRSHGQRETGTRAQSDGPDGAGRGLHVGCRRLRAGRCRGQDRRRTGRRVVVRVRRGGVGFRR